MPRFTVLLPILVPIAFWAVCHNRKDRSLPEPPGYLFLAFLMGIGAAGISRGQYIALGWSGLRHDAGALAESDPLALLAYALLAIGPIEELAKMLPFVLLVIRFREFDEWIDGFVYASFIALGYAAAENWQYLPYLTPIEAAERGFASPVVHIAFVSVWAWWITAARLQHRNIAVAALAGLLLSASLHGLYDFFAISEPGNTLPGAAALVGGLWAWRLQAMRRLRRLEADQG
jgi:RsiW-degrading membrane proteinase PrsW (M82 family)